MQPLRRQAAPAQASAGAAGHDGRLRLVGEQEHGAHLVAIEGEDHAAGHLLQRGRAIEGVGDEILLRREDVFSANDGPQPAEEL